MEAVKKKRRFLRRSVTETLKSVDEALSVEDNHIAVEVLKESLYGKWKDLQGVQESLCTFLEDEEIDQECQDHHEYDKRVLDCLAKIAVYLKSSESSHPNGAQSSKSSNVQVKLPKIELPTFDGDILTWQPYYQSLKVSIIENSSLADVQKLEYIIRSLKGTAAEAVKGFSVVKENYQPVLETLQQRFGKSRVIIDAHVKGLLYEHRLTSDDAVSMRKFYDKVIGHIRSIDAMGDKFKVEALAPVLVPLIVDKLPKRVVEKWELEIGQNNEDCIPIKTLIDFLEQIIRAKESTSVSSTVESSAPREASKSGHGFVKRKPTTSAMHSSTTTYATTSKEICPVCQKYHSIHSCVSFLTLPVKERFRKAGSLKLCFVCLESGHTADKCAKTVCRYCHGRHNHLLHVEQSSASSNVISSSISTNGVGKVILQTVPAVLCGTNGNSQVVRCFLDPGSQTSFIRQGLVEELGLQGNNVKVAVSGFGGIQEKVSTRQRIAFTLAPTDNPKLCRNIEALTAKNICCPADAVTVCPAQWRHLRDIKFAEDFPRDEKVVDVLIGLDYYYTVVTRDIVKGEPTEPVAIRSALGWIFCGPTGNHDDESTSAVSMNIKVSYCNEDQLNDTLQKFWTLESIGIQADECQQHAKTDENVLKQFKDSLTFKDGRYEVSLPWKDEQFTLEDNYTQAENRLCRLERKLLQDPVKAKAYSDAINKYVEGGIAEEVPTDEVIPSDNRHVFYLPHHAVVREDKQTTKTRIVFDASAKSSNGLSLNNCIEAGPSLQPDLVGILLRFRKHKIALASDIEKMFLQISLKSEDRDSHRYLWRDLDIDVNPRIYRMTRVTFGVIASPFLAICTIQEHAKKYQEQFPEVSDEVIKNVYVDDLVTGKDTVPEAVELQRNVKELMHLAAFNLTKWSSNSDELLQEIPEKDRASNTLLKIEENLSCDDTNLFVNTLGIKWNANTDEFMFMQGNDVSGQRTLDKGTYTKREVASYSAKVFDPIGLISPFTVKSKMMLQKLWTEGVSWDEPLSTSACVEWNVWFRERSELSKLRIPRCYSTFSLQDCERLELHAFGDASELAYASAVYLRAISNDGNISTCLVMSKTRVAPLKKITLPRLELMAAVITARLCTYVKKQLDCTIDRILCWTDNSATLHWIRGCASQWKPFVANRVTEIQSLLDPSVWHYCPGPQNPADIPSRGVSVEQLMNCNVWWNGPPWLAMTEDNWPEDLRSSPQCVEAERKSKSTISCAVQTKQKLITYTRFSKYSRLVNTVAWIKRFIHNLQCTKENRALGMLTVPEIEHAELWLFSQVQNECFYDDIVTAREGKLSTCSNLRNLNPFVCTTSSLLRVGGRIHKSILPEDEKHPIILPCNHHVVKLLIHHVHCKELHAGVEHTLAIMRQRFWIIKGRSTVRLMVKNCLQCRHYNTKPCAQRMAPLPADRVVPAPPFTNVGLDFAGPLYLKDSNEKTYICLFTCAVTRAIHLELVSNMTVEKFLLALRRMVARRGMCKIIWSDNAKTFKGANKELTKCWRVLESDETGQNLVEKRIQWKFIDPKAPWWGGFYERLVKSVKTPLKKVFGNAMLDGEQLSTVLTEIEAQINSRPLTHVSAEPNDFGVITPSLILTGRNLQSSGLVKAMKAREQTSNALTKRFEYNQNLKNKFWQQWNADYLKSLIPFKKWLEKTDAIKQGDIVLISEDKVPRGKWNKARVESTHPGRDGLVRSVSLRLPNGKTTRRPIQRLHKLETLDADLHSELC